MAIHVLIKTTAIIKAIIIIGVSGSGKSTVGKLLSKTLDVPFFDADDYHPESNIKKMSDGIPLTDTDRKPWLMRLNEVISTQLETSSCVIACSALKESYRSLLQNGIEDSILWVFLKGSFEQINSRIRSRNNHFMPAALLQSQFDALEDPLEALTIDVAFKPKEIVQMIEDSLNQKAEIGLFGLGVMGKSLSRNMANNGFKLAVYNRHVEGKEEDVAKHFVKNHKELDQALPFDELEQFVLAIEQPRKIMLMVQAGNTIDTVIEDLLPYLSAGDILIDGGNSNYLQTNKREDYLKSKGIYFIGSGVSGGEEGALKGPSIMPGGDHETYAKVAHVFNAISAKDKDGLPCCAYIGPQGSGHFVKMIHNGIEYAEMQLICEVYGVLRSMQYNPSQIAEVFSKWMSMASSYLLEITIDILKHKDGEGWLLDKIMDKAGNKGTGNWATIATAQLGVPSTLISRALFARYSSFYKSERVELHAQYNQTNIENQESPKLEISEDDLLNAYTFGRIVNHYQGFKVMSEASRQYAWNLNLSEIARVWTNGCIIRSDLMLDLIPMLKESNNLLNQANLINKVKECRPSSAKVIAKCIVGGVAIPCLSEAINFFNEITTADSTANLIQAQRDYFGAHTYQRKDDDSEKFYHTQWI